MSFCPSCSQWPQCSVGGRLQTFWQVWQAMGANPRVVSVLREDNTLPFKQRPLLTRFPLIQNGYANPVNNWFLKEVVLTLMNKLVVENMVVKSSLTFHNRLFLVPKPNRKWRPILDLSQLNLYLSTSKMQTLETIRLSLQTGECVTSLDFSDAYFHILINQRSRKYQRFFLYNQTFQFTALPFGLATAPLEFTKVVKEVKHGTSKGYPNPPVPRRLVVESPAPGNLPTTYTDPLGPLPTVRVDCKHEKVRTETPTGLQFRRLLIQPGD